MAFEQNDNSGSLFKNNRKEKENHPDFTGSAKIKGVDYWLSGWTKTREANGEKWISLALKPKEEQPDKPPAEKDVRAQCDDIFGEPSSTTSAPAAGEENEGGGAEDDLPF